MMIPAGPDNKKVSAMADNEGKALTNHLLLTR
nr:MAG TPA: hypothetical protein [Caudoviricetes sp.]